MRALHGGILMGEVSKGDSILYWLKRGPGFVTVSCRYVVLHRRLYLIVDYAEPELRIAQVRVVFSLSQMQREALFGDSGAKVSSHLAYVEWFSRFAAAPSPHHGMHKVKRSYENNTAFRLAEVIPVDRLKCSIQLFPQFGSEPVPSEWTSGNVLDKCDTFYPNPFTSDCTYSLFRPA